MFTLLLVALLAANPAPQHLKLQVGDLEREALIYAPASPEKDAKLPVVFAFHGHGGNAAQAARSFQFQKHWPEALVVYMQGIPTPGRLTDPEGKRNGWQSGAGDQDDRDLKFFDAVLAKLKTDYPIDERRIYATGHSNGGGFTYLLWSQRPDVFAAFAPSAAVMREVRGLKPKPVMHVAGENDDLVKFVWQKLMIGAVKRANKTESEGEQWAADCTLYKSADGAPLVTYIHSGAHNYPAAAPPLIVRFFKEHALPEPKPADK
jgi:polyhydroxybutyrate depolymerase